MPETLTQVVVLHARTSGTTSYRNNLFKQNEVNQHSKTLMTFWGEFLI